MSFVNQFFDFFLPRFCPSCNKKLEPSEYFICSTCIDKIKLAETEFLENEYKRKFAEEKIIADFVCLYVFEKDKELQHIIHSIKYNGNFRLGTYLGKFIGSKLKEKISGWSADFIIPIPLHHLKKAERGYNQSYYIAKGISSIYNIPIMARAIKRNRFTPSQTALNLDERKENIQDAFTFKMKKKLSGKKIILVDDVITTGSTITECGKVLKESGAEKVYALSTAIAGI